MFFLNPCCLIILDALAGKSGVNFKDPCVCVKIVVTLVPVFMDALAEKSGANFYDPCVCAYIVVTCSGVYRLSESFCYKFLPSNLVELFCLACEWLNISFSFFFVFFGGGVPFKDLHRNK